MSSGHTSSGEKLMQASLKQRVKDLEAEVVELKTKLDQLRKAKSTTIVKRKREVVYVGGGEVKRQSKANEADKPSSTDPSHSQKKEDAAGRDDVPAVSLLTLIDGEEKNPTTLQDEGTVKKEQEDSIRKLFQRISELNDRNIALTIENSELVCKVAELTSELSVNEANKCDREEKIRAEISAEWRQKYDFWMEEMEKKMAEINLQRQ